MDPTSPENYDDNASDTQDEFVEDDVKQERVSQMSPSATSSTMAHSQDAKQQPMQKRRRVTRACDECRRKKIKCDGTQPCTHCAVYSYDCTYDQPSNRRRNPAPQYIENLEHRVHRAETLLKIVLPDVDLNDPSIDVALARGVPPPTGHNASLDTTSQLVSKTDTVAENDAPQNKEVRLESMVRAVGQLDLDEQGFWDYRGHSSGLSFVRRIREQFPEIMGPDTKATPFIKSRPMSQVLDSPKSSHESSSDGSWQHIELPSREAAQQFCGMALNDAAALLRFIHHPSFWRSFNRIYDIRPENYVNEDHRFLPLLYMAVALGSLFSPDEHSELDQLGYENAIETGFRYFRAARASIDIADCRELTQIQAVIFMILFLQSSAKLSQCYSYVGVALRAALRMGLHRSFARNFNPVEAEVRKRVFWVIRQMDIYVGAMLGLPQTLSDEDIDQDLPLEVDDEYITEEGLLEVPEGTISISSALNAHIRLVQLLSKIVRNIYPIKVKNPQGNPEKSYTVPFSVIREIEHDLETWKSHLPAFLGPSDTPSRFTRVQHLLRLAYAHAQVLLYRPFLHFTSHQKRSGFIDQRAYTCAASYVNVSRNIIHMTTQMKQKGLLNGAFWFIMYSTFFSILSLVYFAAENPDNATTEAVMRDANEGRRTLASLAKRSMAADRCTVTLTQIFDRLPEWLREGHHPHASSKKRRQDLTNTSLTTQPVRSQNDVHTSVQEEPSSRPKQASTLPEPGPPPPRVDQLDTPAPIVSQDLYTPTSNVFPQNFTSNSMSATNAMNNALQQFAAPQTFANPSMPDLIAMTSMMFPSDEALAYPNQPLTTFENNRFGKQNLYDDFDLTNGQPDFTTINTMPSNVTLATENDNMEAQFYPLPPSFMQQLPQNQFAMQQMPGTSTNGAPPVPLGGMVQPSNATATNTSHWSNQQDMAQQFPEIDFNEIFGGEEWNSMFAGNQRFRQ
ncbi:Gypsy retrotransposon integrase-like protein 1 [Elasticomyces elasticus]|nr:Gypsy retrotransposon integrase-like protein 1 [Elasticomyces elasticus]KAK4984737.1 Gypsy retrotransposon integrase-like protein 1 [Elasticomyces elasticus]